MTTTKLDTNARYAVKGFEGIAFLIHGFPKRFEPWTTLAECDDSLCACHDDESELHEVDTGEGEEVEQDESCGRVLVVMVGDDRKHEVDTDDLSPLARRDYCGSCGQIGCGHDAPDED